jgi:hypothetical protein
VATYETTLNISKPLDETFAFVSDFRNAAVWDPRTYSVDKTTDGPIGVGTRFMLTGGMLPGSLLERLHLAESLIGMALPYGVIEWRCCVVRSSGRVGGRQALNGRARWFR